MRSKAFSQRPKFVLAQVANYIPFCAARFSDIPCAVYDVQIAMGFAAHVDCFICHLIPTIASRFLRCVVYYKTLTALVKFTQESQDSWVAR